jgi:hypothetical protein
MSCVRVQVHFKNNVSLRLKNRIRISGFFHQCFYLESPDKPGKVQNTGFLEPVRKPIENPNADINLLLINQ